MNGADRLLAECMTAALVCACVTDAARCGDGHAEVDGIARAKSMLVLKVTFYADVELSDMSMEISFDGNLFVTALLGLPRPDRLFKSITRGTTGTTVMVPAVAGFAVGDPQFFIQEAGTYWVKWGANSKTEGGTRELEVRQAIHAQQPSQSDLALLERISDPALLRHLFGEDVFDRQPDAIRERMLSAEGADRRALKVIGQLLLATRGDAPDKAVRKRKGKESLQTWADVMWKLAQDYPESSYAPYAAYYAACCYYALGVNRAIEAVRAKRVPGSRIDQIAEFEHRASLIKNDPDCAKAGEAFSFAAERADNYLRPRAICMQASLRKWVGAFDEAEALLDKAAALGGEGGTIHELVDKMRKGLARVKERQLGGQHEQDGE